MKFPVKDESGDFMSLSGRYSDQHRDRKWRIRYIGEHEADQKLTGRGIRINFKHFSIGNW